MRWTMLVPLAFSVGCGSEPPTTPTPISPSPPTELSWSGRVVESDSGAPVEGAQVCWAPTADFGCATTAPDGTYALVTGWPSFVPRGTLSQITLAPTVSKDGFEYRQSSVPWDGGPRITWSPSLQPIIQIDAGQSVSATVFPREGSGLILEDDCEGCKRIRIAAQRDGMLTYQLKSDSSNLRLWLPYYGQGPVGGPIAVRAGETAIVWVAGSVAPARFELSTTLTH